MAIARHAFLAAVAAALLAACGGDGDTGGEAGAGGGTAGGGDTLVMGDNFFEPEHWGIPADGGTFTVTNDGAALHNLTIEEAGIDEDVAPDDEIEVEIDLDPGEYEMVCEYHIAQGMTGTVVVE